MGCPQFRCSLRNIGTDRFDAKGEVNDELTRRSIAARPRRAGPTSISVYALAGRTMSLPCNLVSAPTAPL